MHNRSIIPLLFIFIVWTGCSPRPYGIVDIDSSIQKAKRIEGEEIPSVLGSEPEMIMQLEKTSTLYIAFHLPETDTLLFDIRNGKGEKLQRFARKGNGPNEYLAPFLRNVREEGQAITFDLMDVERGRMDSYSYDSAENSLRMVRSDKLPQDVIPIGQLLRTDRGYFGIQDNVGSDIFTMDGQMENLQKHPYAYTQEMTIRESQLFHTSSCASQDGKHIALAFMNLPRMDIVSSDGTTEHVYFYGKRQTVTDARNEDRYFGYIRCDENYLYVKYLADKQRHLILKMTWKGTIVEVFDIDYDLLSFNVIDGILYGLAFSPESGREVYVHYDVS